MRRTDQSTELRSTINVTPLIDVLLVLLVIFMIVTPVVQKGMTSQLPQKATELLQPQDTDKQLIVTINEAGTFLLNQEAVDASQFSKRLSEVLLERGGRRLLFLHANDALPYGTVMQAMDLCRGAGAQEIGIVLDALTVQQ